jgi:hypothetical protein
LVTALRAGAFAFAAGFAAAAFRATGFLAAAFFAAGFAAAAFRAAGFFATAFFAAGFAAAVLRAAGFLATAFFAAGFAAGFAAAVLRAAGFAATARFAAGLAAAVLRAAGFAATALFAAGFAATAFRATGFFAAAALAAGFAFAATAFFAAGLRPVDFVVAMFRTSRARLIEPPLLRQHGRRSFQHYATGGRSCKAFRPVPVSRAHSNSLSSAGATLEPDDERTHRKRRALLVVCLVAATTTVASACGGSGAATGILVYGAPASVTDSSVLIWRARADGTHAVRLTGGFSPDLSPDARTIGFYAPGPNESAVSVVSPAGLSDSSRRPGPFPAARRP